MVSFNASRKATTHPLQAAYFLECLHDEMMAAGELSPPEDPRTAPLYSPMVYAGVCTGSAVVRQVGAATLLRTQVVGHVVAQASSLMRLAKSRETSVLLSDTVIAALHGIQLQTQQNSLHLATTMIPGLLVHYSAIVKVPMRSATMLTGSLFRAADAPVGCTAGLHARLRGNVAIGDTSLCDLILCRASPPNVTARGIADANRAMSTYHSGHVESGRVLAQRCSEDQPPHLTQFFFATGVLHKDYPAEGK